ncbi:MAG: hypothetical protein WB783_15045 [Arenicellales bacterium]
MEVLLRPVLRLEPPAIVELLLLCEEVGEYVSPSQDTLSEITDLDFPDRDDFPFYAAAFVAHCPLVTGNRKHYPTGGPVEVLNPGEFIQTVRTR